MTALATHAPGVSSVGSTLTTARLRLRRLRADDVEALVELDADPAVMRWLSGGSATPREFIEEVVLPGFLASYPCRPWLGVWVIEDPAGAFLGWVSLRPELAELPDRATLGYRLRRPGWGRGIATEAARAVVDRAFQDGDLVSAAATVYEANLASRRVLRKLGFREVRRQHLTHEDLDGIDTFPGGGAVWDGDDVIYRLDRAGWLASRAWARGTPRE
jgi:RimJ/RimL family protein N-acetyltransferase